ncbi:MAG: DNA mismatch endonuclease Vsr [Armatimonadetes bacterium]|nr:DNA mismatch endonuclease Vsr [Armatimonadota bacterium]
MKSQKRRNTKPELAVRRIVSALGCGYRVQNRDLPGSPDLANRKRGWAIFVHGCYWHHHRGCQRATVPRANRDWWLQKFAANRERDSRKQTELGELGLKVIVVWECEILDARALTERLEQELSPHRSHSQ